MEHAKIVCVQNLVLQVSIGMTMMSPMILSYLYTQVRIRNLKVCSICVLTKPTSKGHVSTRGIGTGVVWGGGTPLTL